MITKLLILPNLVLLVLGVLGDPIVQLPTGKILGSERTTFDNKKYYGFEAIPYAAPPIGPLRFKPPQPPQSWDGILNATFLNNMCYQITGNADVESEDCLYLNILTPKLPDESDESLPVMFFIDGRGFTDGYPQSFVPDYFISNGVIYGSLNYRVGIFGFLSTQDEVIPGNNGLKDQQLALQWLHNNIHLFGGDPDRITIFGQDAGSASITYQLLNPNNDGLFQNVILQSGTFLSPWALQRNARKIAFETAALINPDLETDDSQALLEFLQSVDARDLDDAASKYKSTLSIDNLEISQGDVFAPVIEAKNPDAFLTKKMYGLLNAGSIVKVPTLIGFTSEERLNPYQDEDQLKPLLQILDQNLDWLVSKDMQILNGTDRTEMGKKIRELYTGGEPFSSNLGDGVRYFSDNSVTRSTIKYAEIYSKLAKTYFYQFSYSGIMGRGGSSGYDGTGYVADGEDLYYLFCLFATCGDSAYPEADRTTRQRLLKLWTDFAKYQDPTPEPSELLQNVAFPALETESGDFLYLDIDENLEVKNHPKEETYKGWLELYDSLGFSDFDTY